MKPRRKYGNTKTEYNGVLYDSKKEAKYAGDLDLLLRAGEIRGWTRQVTIKIAVNKEHICNCIVDFLIHHKDDSWEYVEVKGMPTAVFKLKKKLIEKVWLPEHPDCRYTVV